MDGNRPTWYDRGTASTPTVDCARLVCDCGQDLDCCSGEHCPRCGATRQCGGPVEHLERGPLGWVA